MKIKTWQFILLISILIVSTTIAGCSGGSSASNGFTPTATTSSYHNNSTNSNNVPTISAMEGFSLAEKEALSWKTDAVSGDIIGTVINPNEDVPINGKATKWLYFFVSPSSKEPFSLIIIVFADGNVSSSEKGMNITSNPSGLAYSSEIGKKDGWKIDSTEAVQTALPLFKTKYNTDAVAAGYTLEDNRTNGANDFYWEIILLGPSNNTSMPAIFSDKILKVNIDATTGAVIKGPMYTL